MWNKGEIVWVSLNLSDKWIPGRILDSSESFGVLVSFFGLTEPRYVSKPCLRSFERDFGTLVSDSRSFGRFVNRALRSHFWNISSGLWCSCQPSIDSPYFDTEKSLPLFTLTSNSALGFVRDMAISLRVTLRRLAEINNSSAQILSFRRYTVDLKRSKSVYEETRESAKLVNYSEEPDWFLDPSNQLDCIGLVPDVEDPLPKDIICCSSEQYQPVGKLVQVYTWNTRNPLSISGSSTMKACETMAQTAGHEDDSHPSKSRECCLVEQSICFLNSEPAVEEDVIEEDTTNMACPRGSVSAQDVVVGTDGRTVISENPLVNASNDKAFLAKPVSFVVPKACETLACSVQETYAKPRNKPVCHMISAETLNEELSERNTSKGTRENCSYDGVIAPPEKLQDLNAAATVENQTRAVDNVRSIGIKRKVSRDNASKDSKRKKKAGQQSVSTDKPLNLHLFKDIRFADPKCLRMKFSSRHGNLPSKAELLKRFSVFGKIDPSRTDVNPEKSSAKVVFLQSIDAVTAYQFARSKKFTLGRSKVTFQLDPFEGNSVVNTALMSEKHQKSVPSPKSCLKEHSSVDKEERRNRKVTFQIETNS